MSNYFNKKKKDILTDFSLNAYQCKFSEMLLNSTTFDPTELEQVLQLSGNRERLSIYTNNVHSSRIQVLNDIFPISLKLVGDQFFNAVAGAYFEIHPPSTPYLHLSGNEFPSFLKTFKHTKDMVFLHDIAKLELLWNTAYHAEDRTVLEITKIRNLDPARVLDCVAILHPSCGVFSGQIPVYDTWQAIRSDSVDVDYLETKTPQNIFVTRQEEEVVVFCIPKEICVFIECVLKQQTIGAALMAVNSMCPGVNLTECTDFLFHQNLIVELQ